MTTLSGVMETIDYREVLYSTYVSGHKKHTHERVSEDDKNRFLDYLEWCYGDWFVLSRSNPKVLDLGCGSGLILSLFERLGYRDIHGVDLSEEQVLIARERFPHVALANMFDYLKAQEGNSFDLVTGFDLVEHLTRSEMLYFFREVLRVLKPGGRLIIQMPNGDSPFSGAVQCSDPTHESLYTSTAYRHILFASGFDVLGFRERKPRPVGLKGYVRSFLWKCLRSLIKVAHYVETGAPSTNIYSRVFACCAVKPS